MLIHYPITFLSNNLNDRKTAIPLLKGINERLSLSTARFHIMNAGYDYEPIYKQVHRMNQQSIITYNRRNEREPLGFDKHFAPTALENTLINMIVMMQNIKH